MALSNIKNTQGYIKEFQSKDLNPKSCNYLFVFYCAMWKKSTKIWICVGHFKHMIFKCTKVIHILHPKFKMLQLCFAWQPVVLRTRLRTMYCQIPLINEDGENNLKGYLIIETPISSQWPWKMLIKDVTYLENISLYRLQLYISLLICFCTSSPLRKSAL